RDSEDPKWLEKVLSSRHADALQRDELTFRLDDARITLRGDKAAVNACLADIDAMAAALSRSIEVTAYRLPMPANGLPSPFSDGPSLQARIANAPPIWSARATTRPGGAVQLGDARWTSHVRDLDAEVAEEATIHDPKIDPSFRGERVALTVHVLPGDQLLLHGSWRIAEGDDAVEVATGGDKPNVDHFMRRTGYVTFAGTVRSGDGLMVGAREASKDGMQFLFAVHARFVGPSPPPTNDLMVFPASAWTTAVDASFSLRAGPFPGEERSDRPPVLDMPVLSPDNLAAFLKPGEGTIAMHGSTLVVDDRNAVCARTELALRQLAEAQLHGAALQVHRRANGEMPSLAIVQPVLAGVPAHAFVGRTWSLVTDYDVEIAKGASTSNPIVTPVRGGVWSRLLAHRSGQGWHVEGMWRHTVLKPTRTLHLRGSEGMLLLLPDYVNTTWPWDGEMAVDREHELSPGFSVQLDERS
ncbi:MAG: hypothetical protein KAI24_24555, partial [Planctomycetes bacterium]|nr:hypothetical protein [Planctomycetota bacterium]